MIFVTVGTTEFDELIRQMDELAPRLDEPVICQIGRGTFLPRRCEHFRYAPSLERYLQQARVVVGHGGLGTIMAAVRLGKPFVGISNRGRPDQHQDQILSSFESRRYAIWCKALDDLADCIQEAGRAKLTPYVEPPCHIPEVIGQFLRGSSTRAGAGALQRVRS
jgi:beta-1,4-N-acetylglucosaminyltransferase